MSPRRGAAVALIAVVTLALAIEAQVEPKPGGGNSVRILWLFDVSANVGNVRTVECQTQDILSVDVGGVSTFRIFLKDGAFEPRLAADFTLADGGAGQPVIGDGTASAMWQTDANGFAEIDITDVGGGGGDFVVIEIVGNISQNESPERVVADKIGFIPSF